MRWRTDSLGASSVFSPQSDTQRFKKARRVVHASGRFYFFYFRYTNFYTSSSKNLSTFSLVSTVMM
jgi:hypothetical protein